MGTKGPVGTKGPAGPKGEPGSSVHTCGNDMLSKLVPHIPNKEELKTKLNNITSNLINTTTRGGSTPLWST